MAKARRNLTQLRKDNRTSNKVLVCTAAKCDCDFYVSYPRNGKVTITRKCAVHFATPPQDKRKDKTITKLRSMGLL